MRPLGFLHILIASLVVATGCSTPDSRRSTEPDPDSYDSKAHPASYGMESAFLGKSQKVRPANDFQFYYKNCTQTDNRSYYSKTSYWCNDR